MFFNIPDDPFPAMKVDQIIRLLEESEDQVIKIEKLVNGEKKETSPLPMQLNGYHGREWYQKLMDRDWSQWDHPAYDTVNDKAIFQEYVAFEGKHFRTVLHIVDMVPRFGKFTQVAVSRREPIGSIGW